MIYRKPRVWPSVTIKYCGDSCTFPLNQFSEIGGFECWKNCRPKGDKLATNLANGNPGVIVTLLTNWGVIPQEGGKKLHDHVNYYVFFQDFVYSPLTHPANLNHPGGSTGGLLMPSVSWLYLARRSDRHGAPVLICPVPGKCEPGREPLGGACQSLKRWLGSWTSGCWQILWFALKNLMETWNRLSQICFKWRSKVQKKQNSGCIKILIAR